MRRSHVRALPLLILALTAAVAACGDDPIGPVLPEDVDFAPELGVDLDEMTKLESGVYVQTLEPGQGGLVGTEGRVVVDYTGWLPNGQEFDAGEDAEFQLNGVIPGFALGLESAREGETRLMVIPSALGYGAGGAGGIPPHSVLVFRVHVDAVNPPG